jgi:carotenoid cleavage dioxygenase-like enzyme
VKTVKGPPYMAFHYINAWESDDGKTAYVTVPMFEDPEMVNGLSLERARSSTARVEPSRVR